MKLAAWGCQCFQEVGFLGEDNDVINRIDQSYSQVMSINVGQYPKGTCAHACGAES